MDTLPVISPELIEYLERIYPDASPLLTTGEREIWFTAGKVDLVRHLKFLHDEQNLTILEGS